MGVLFVVVGLVWLGEVFVTYLVGCWRVLAPPPVGRNLHCGWRIRSRAVVVSQQGISLLEGRCVSAGVFLWLPRLPITSRPYFWDIFLTPMQDLFVGVRY